MADRLTIEVEPREASGSRSARRLRRSGFVPGVLYDGAALIDVKFGKEKTVPAILKDRQIHPVRGEVTHIDFLEVDLKEKIRAMVALELLGADEAVGVKDGGILDHATREVEIEALPTDIPECIEVDVSALNVGDTLTLDKVATPDGVDLVHEHLEDVVVASVVVPTKVEEPEIEEETELVGEAAAEAEGGDDSGDSGGGE
jgi:large subunit ribosomal protein L25